MIELTTKPRNGIIPSAQVTLIPQAASNPVITLNTIATQNLVLPRLVKTAKSTVNKLNTIKPRKMALTSAARDSMPRLCPNESLFFTRNNKPLASQGFECGQKLVDTWLCLVLALAASSAAISHSQHNYHLRFEYKPGPLSFSPAGNRLRS